LPSLTSEARNFVAAPRISTLSGVLSLSAAVLLLAASPALAVSISFDLQQGSQGGFGYSSLHDADDSSPMSGPSLGSLSGTLVLDYDGVDTYSFVSSTVVLASATYSFALTGGELMSDGGGYLGFDLTGAGPYAHSGSLLFTGGAPVCCGVDGPNRIDPTELRLWGASDIRVSGGNSSLAKRIGMDLGAASNPVPEPSAALAFVTGLLVVQRAVRRRSH
jgi:hypothetical protein